MKNNFKISAIAVLCSAFALISCSDFLTEDNRTGQTADLTYSTKSGIDGLLSGCYSFARGFYGKEGGLGLTEGGTDLFYDGMDNKQRTLAQYTLTATSLDNNNSNNPALDHYWELFYCAIDVCNTAIKFIPLCAAIDDKIKDQYLGEAYFLKAFYNFHIVNIWGDAPYNDGLVTIDNITSSPTRMKEAEIYNYILEDINTSISSFESSGYKIKTEGRANYWAARALKARILLYKASWLKDDASYALAQAEAEAVIGSGIAQFYPNYAETWYMENEDIAVNKEAIWAVTYSSDLKTAANCIPKRYRVDADNNPLNYVDLLTRTGYSRGGNTMMLMFASLWNNGRSDIAGDVFARITVPGATITNTKTGEKVDITWYSRYSRGFTRYLPSLYLWQTLEQYRETDQRVDATLLTAYTILPGLEGSSKFYPNMTDTAIYYSPLDGNSAAGQALQAHAKNRYRLQFAYGGEIPVYSSGNPATARPTAAAVPMSSTYGDDRYNGTNIGGMSSFPGIKKFLDWFNTKAADEEYLTHDISYRDAVVFRLAEMYLIKAECQLKTNPNGALATLNELRAVRAIPGKDNSRNGTVTIDTILEERAIELCGEKQRWFDLKRTGKLVEYVLARNAPSNNIKPFHVYRPIPEAQMNACTNVVAYPGSEGNFWQNEGY
jgi:SusD family.